MVITYHKVETYTFDIEFKIEMPPTILRKQQINQKKTYKRRKGEQVVNNNNKECERIE